MGKGIDRRGFIVRSGAGVASAVMMACGEEASLPEGAEFESSQTAGPASLMIGFQAYSLRHFAPMETFIPEAKKLGLEYVELYSALLSTEASPEEVRLAKQKLAAIGLKVNAYGVERFSADHAKNEAVFRFGKELGVANLSANPTKDAFASLEKLVDQYDIQIAIHNHGPEDKVWGQPQWVYDAVKDLDPRIGACLDTGWVIMAGVDAVDAIEMLGPRVLGVHLKDFTPDGQEVIPGDGLMDLDRTLTALLEIGFDGPISIEYEENKENPVPDMLETVRRIEACMKG
jgi:sugar phosphate isomerase/epimerase